MKTRKKSRTLVVRLPEEIVKQLYKLQDENNLVTVGSALRYWIEQQQNEKIEAKLSELKALISDLADAILKAHKKSNFLSIALTSFINEIGGNGDVIEDGIRRIDKASISKLGREDWLEKIFEKSKT